MHHHDPLLFDVDRLTTIASEAVVRRGVAYFREQRVTDITWDDAGIRAVVHGSQSLSPYHLQLGVDDGEVVATCTCPFDGEPLCKHAVAALLAYAARQPIPEVEGRDAADAAVEDRATRARTEVQVRHVSGDRWFGGWESWTVDAAPGSMRRYRVDIRALRERINHCTCPDFATNRLGTCKHIEAVLQRLRDRGPRRFETLAARGPETPVVYLRWDCENAPQISVAGPREGVEGWFDASGALIGELPRAWHDVAEAVGAVATVGPDVIAYVRRIDDDAISTVRAERIREEIRRLGSHIPGVKARLYPYQVDGVAFLAATRRAVLADDMGLGKTLQAIAACAWLLQRGDVARCLVVCPSSLKHQWQREILKFTGREAVVVTGEKARREFTYRQGAALTIVNYEVLVRDHDVVQRLLAPDVLVLDEAQRIKNWKTRTAAAVKQLRTTYAFILSGTPLENRLEDLYSLLQVVDSRVLGPLWRYLLDFHVTDARGKILGYRNLGELRRRLRPVLLRRDRSLVRDQLPDRIESRRDLALDSRQRTLHDEAMDLAGRLALIAQRRPLTPEERDRLMRLLQRARMVCDAAGLVDKETVGSPKLDELARLLEELCVEGGRKVVIFSQWERMTAMAADVARGLGLGTVSLHGGVPTPKRGALIDRFFEDPEVQVFLSTDAGGVGLNLQCATALINLDVPWNPAVLDQRVARVHRLGQREPVQIVHLVAVDAYEARVAELVSGKRLLFDNVVDEDASEDVVGLSRKGIDAALATLQPARPGAEVDAGDEPMSADPLPVRLGDGDSFVPPPQPGQQEMAVEPPGAREHDSADQPVSTEDLALQRTVAAIDIAFGPRVERIFAAGAGLVVVLRHHSPEDLRRAERIEGALPVMPVDAATAAALGRMGLVQPVNAPLLRTPPVDLGALVWRDLDAASAAVERGQVHEVMGFVLSALLRAAAMVADVEAPSLEAAPIWLYATALPKGWISVGDASLISQAYALRGVDGVPDSVATSLIDAARHAASRLLAAD